MQSWSERHGEHSEPTPLQTPALGVQKFVWLFTHWSVEAQLALLPHSGAQTPDVGTPPSAVLEKSQCCATFCALGGQSSSRVHVWVFDGPMHSFQCGTHCASGLQLTVVAQCGVQYMFPWLSGVQYCGRPSNVGGQSWSSWHGSQ
jgi:hypothetical protein